MPVAATRADALRLKVGGQEVRSLTPVGTVAGVAVRAVAGRGGGGTGHLRSRGDGTELSWKAPGSSSYGDPVACGTDGTYLLEDGDDRHKWARVQVYTSYLVGGGQEAAVLLGEMWNNGVGSDDVSAAEATSGDVETYELAVKNDGPMGVLDVKCWLVSTAGLEVSKDGANWCAPDAEDHADVLVWDSIASGAQETLHVRRTIGAEAAYDPDVLNRVALAWDGY